MAARFNLDLLLRVIDRASGPLQRVHDRVERLTRPTTSLQNKLASNMAVMGQIGTRLGLDVLPGKFMGVYNAAASIGDAVDRTKLRIIGMSVLGGSLAYTLKSQFIDTADEMARMGLRLQAIEGGAEGAMKAMAFIKRTSIDSPFEFKDVSASYALLKSAGLDPTKQIGGLNGIIDQVAKRGGTSEDLWGVNIALSQMLNANRINAQDANQLVQRQIPVWNLLAAAAKRATGKAFDVKTLREMSKEGKLGIGAIRLLIEEMGRDAEGFSKKTAKSTVAGLWSGVMDQVKFFYQRVMKVDDAGRAIQGGLMDRITTRLSGILDLIDRMASDGRLDRWASIVDQKLTRLWEGISTNAIPFVKSLASTLGEVFTVADNVAQVFGGWSHVIPWYLAAYIAGPLVSAVFSLGVSIGSLAYAGGASLATIVISFGWIAAAIGAVIYAGYLLIKNWASIKRWGLDLGASLKRGLGGMADFVINLFALDFPKAVDGFVEMLKGIGRVLTTALRPFFWAWEKATGLKVPDAIWPREKPKALEHMELVSPHQSAQRMLNARRIIGGPSGGVLEPVLSRNPMAREDAARVDLAVSIAQFAKSVKDFTEGRLTVEFTNAPAGTRVRGSNRAPIDFAIGHAFAEIP